MKSMSLPWQLEEKSEGDQKMPDQLYKNWGPLQASENLRKMLE